MKSIRVVLVALMLAGAASGCAKKTGDDRQAITGTLSEVLMKGPWCMATFRQLPGGETLSQTTRAFFTQDGKLEILIRSQSNAGGGEAYEDIQNYLWKVEVDQLSVSGVDSASWQPVDVRIDGARLVMDEQEYNRCN